MDSLPVDNDNPFQDQADPAPAPHLFIDDDSEDEIFAHEQESVSPADLDDLALAASSRPAVPQSFKDAINSPDRHMWEEAMDSEFASLIMNQTWTMVPLPPGRKCVATRWCYDLKYLPDGSIDKYKARMVAKGFRQQAGIDYEETFSPVVNHVTIRYVFSLCAPLKLKIRQYDVSTAFLNGDIDVEIYVKQPEGFITPGSEHLVLRLHKALYGLKQSARLWNRDLHQTLLSSGFSSLPSDSAVYIRSSPRGLIIILLWVDDLQVFYQDEQDALDVESHLFNTYKMKHVTSRIFVGYEYVQDPDTLAVTLHQHAYIRDTLDEFGIVQPPRVTTPMHASISLSTEDCPRTEADRKLMLDKPYRKLIGCLMFLTTCTRPDIGYAVGFLSRFLVNPGIKHWEAGIRILHYLYHTIGFALQYSSPSPIVAYVDADWAGCVSTGRSTSGQIFLSNGAAISWKSGRQPIISTSSTHAEYIAMSDCSRELVWIKALATQLGALLETPLSLHDSHADAIHQLAEILPDRHGIILYGDNDGAMALAKNPVRHSRMKHIFVRYHFIRERVDAQDLTIMRIDTEYQLADFLTKPVPFPKHSFCLKGIGLICRSL
jgi:hypothetical protein